MSQTSSNADRNLLFGVLAFQMDFVSREQLITAMQAWVFDKSKSLGEILAAHKALEPDSRQLLEALVQKHLAMHDNSPEKSLAAVSSVSSVKKDLGEIADDDVQASVTLVGVNKEGLVDPYMTLETPPSQIARGGMRFRILRPHAKGGLGEVFVARDEELHREVALKEIQSRQADNLQSRSRFMLEAEITGGLEHPGIVPVYGLGTYADGRPYYAMRFIRGDSLKEAIERFHKAEKAGMDPGHYALELRQLLGRFIDVCNAIAYAHSRGVLHRDLKPGNIMLGKYGETLVVDWGLAKPLGESLDSRGSTEPGEGSLIPSSHSAGSATLVGSAIGTPQYMSPEQAAGKVDQLGPAADIYSLGATLYCLLTGRPPVVESGVGVVLQKVQKGEFPRLREVKPSVPPALEAICLKALALRPADRYATPYALANDIEHWLADEPVSAWPEPWTARARRWMSRHRTLVTGVAAAVGVALVGFVIATVLLTAANERERRAKDKAEANFQLARQAVDKYHTEVSESVLLHEPGMAPLRRNLLVAARDYYDGFVRERAGDPSVKKELGKATFRLAQITADIDSEIKGIKLHEDAIQLLGTPTDAETQMDLAACYHHLGRLQRKTDQIPKSEESYGKALKLWEALVKDHAKDDRYRTGLARTQLGLGNVYQLTRKLDEAEKLYRPTLETRADLAKANPKSAELQRELAMSHHDLGVLLRYTAGKEKEAEAEFRAALKIQRKLTEDAPHISQYQQDVARTLLLLGKLVGEAELKEAVEVREALVKRHPDVTDFHATLCEAKVQLADFYRVTGNPKLAEEVVRDAIKLQRKLAEKYDKIENFQGDLGRGLSTLGDVLRSSGKAAPAQAAYEEAIRVLEKPARELVKVPHYRRALAQTWNNFGLLHASEKQDAKADETFRKALAIWEKLVADHPEEAEFALGLSTTCFNLGNQAMANANFKDALPWYTRAQEAVDARKLPGAPSSAVKDALTGAHWKRAETLKQLGRTVEALAEWDRVVELAREKQRPFFEFQRATELARAGRHVEAAKEADRLLPMAKTGADYYRFAALYALTANAANNSINLTPEECKAIVEPLAAKALKLLDDAKEKNYFKTPANLQRLQADPDLQELRPRPEFKKLLSGFDGAK